MATLRVLPVLCAIALSEVQATACDKLLVPDESFEHRDVATDLSYLAIIDQSNFSEHKQKAGAGLGLPIAKGILEASTSYSDFSQKRRRKYEEYRFHYSNRDLATFYERRLPRHLAEEYNRCMNRFGFRVQIVRSDPDFVELVVSWVPFPGAATKVLLSEFFVDGASVVSSPPTQLVGSGTYTINFRRESGKDFRFNANVGDTTASAFAPRFITGDVKSVAPSCTLSALEARVPGCPAGYVYAGAWSVKDHWGTCISAGECPIDVRATMARDCGGGGWVYVGPNAAHKHGGHCVRLNVPGQEFVTRTTSTTKDCGEGAVYVGPNRVLDHWGTCLSIRGQ